MSNIETLIESIGATKGQLLDLVNVMDNQLAEAVSRLSDADIAIGNLTDRNNNQAAEITRLAGALAEAENRCTELDRTNSVLRNNNDRQAETIEAMRRDGNVYVERIDSLLGELNQVGARETDLVQQLAEVSRISESRREEIATLSDYLADARIVGDDYAKECTTLKAEISSLQDVIETIRAAVTVPLVAETAPPATNYPTPVGNETYGAPTGF